MVKLYGHSDDCVIVDGDIKDELHPYDDEKGMYIAFSDGTTAHIKYGLEENDPDGWTIKILTWGHPSTVLHEPALMRQGDQYSDLLSIDVDIKWMVFGSGFKRK